MKDREDRRLAIEADIAGLNALVSSLNVRAAGMVSENVARAGRGEAPAYHEECFFEIADDLLKLSGTAKILSKTAEGKLE